MKKLITFLFLILSYNCIAVPTPDESNFIVISDIHFDPFIGSRDPATLAKKLLKSKYTDWDKIFEKYGSQIVSQPKQDTNNTLLNLFITFLNNKDGRKKDPDFIIINGDFIGHTLKSDFDKYSKEDPPNYKNFVKNIYQYIMSKFKASFPDTPIFCSIGNNDSFNGDYYVSPKGDFYSFLSDSTLNDNWYSCFQNKRNKKRFKREFSECGYYEVKVPKSNNNKIIVLNSVLLSKNAKGPSAEVIDDAAAKQFEWLEKRLDYAKSNNSNVLILSHIPFGPDAFTTIYSKPEDPPSLFLTSAYNKEFIELLSNNSTVIKGVILGHIHSDAFNFARKSADTADKNVVFGTILPALSPLFGNNPAFKVYTYDRSSMQLKNYKVYYLNIWEIDNPIATDWVEEYDFSRVYSSQSLETGMLNFTKNGKTAPLYRNYYDTGAKCQYINVNTKGNYTYWDNYWDAINSPNPGKPLSSPQTAMLSLSVVDEDITAAPFSNMQQSVVDKNIAPAPVSVTVNDISSFIDAQANVQSSDGNPTPINMAPKNEENL